MRRLHRSFISTAAPSTVCRNSGNSARGWLSCVRQGTTRERILVISSPCGKALLLLSRPMTTTFLIGVSGIAACADKLCRPSPLRSGYTSTASSPTLVSGREAYRWNISTRYYLLLNGLKSAIVSVRFNRVYVTKTLMLTLSIVSLGRCRSHLEKTGASL